MKLGNMTTWREKLKLRLPAWIMLGAMVIFWSTYDRYEPVGPLLISSPALSDAALLRGEVFSTADGFSLQVPEGGTSARIDFTVPKASLYTLFRVRGEMRVEGVQQGRYKWDCARVILVQYDDGNKWIPGHNGLVSRSGSGGWRMSEDVFERFPNAATTLVSLQQAGRSGRADFRKISVEPVELKDSFFGWRLFFGGAWLVMGGLYFSRCRLRSRPFRVLILLNAMVILAGTLMPGEWISSTTNHIDDTIAEWQYAHREEQVLPSPSPVVSRPSPVERLESIVDRKVESQGVGHFVLFASLCYLVYLSGALERRRPLYFIKVGFDVLIFASISETLQFLTLDRTAGIGDLKIDVYGMIAAWILFLLTLPGLYLLRLKSVK